MNRYRLLSCLCLGLSFASLSACTVVVDGDRVQCKTDSDCTVRGTAYAGSVCTESICHPDPTWACLDETPATEDPTGTVHVDMSMEDLISQKPVPSVRFTLCAKLDANCLFPIAQYQSNEAGKLNVEMPAGFDGYFQTDGGGVYPTMFFPPSTRKQRASSTLPMVPTSFFGIMFSQISGPVSEDRSVVMTTALDCQARPATGMALSSPQADERTVTYVIQGGLPSRTAGTTDATGNGGFVNIKAGSVVVTSTMAGNNRPVGTVAVQTRPGYLTMVLVMPTGS